jgi:hypothetical protein
MSLYSGHYFKKFWVLHHKNNFSTFKDIVHVDGMHSHPNGKSYKQGDVMAIMLICLEIKVLLSHNITEQNQELWLR